MCYCRGNTDWSRRCFCRWQKAQDINQQALCKRLCSKSGFLGRILGGLQGMPMRPPRWHLQLDVSPFPLYDAGPAAWLPQAPWSRRQSSGLSLAWRFKKASARTGSAARRPQSSPSYRRSSAAWCTCFAWPQVQPIWPSSLDAFLLSVALTLLYTM